MSGKGGEPRLARLRTHCQGSTDLAVRTTVASVCEALLAAGEQRWGEAARMLADTLPGLPRVGGSAAQREIVDALPLYCLVSDGQADRALALRDGRLDRRTSPLDRRRRDSLVTPEGAPLRV